MTQDIVFIDYQISEGFQEKMIAIRSVLEASITNLAIWAIWYLYEYREFGELQFNRECDNIVAVLYFVLTAVLFYKWNKDRDQYLDIIQKIYLNNSVTPQKVKKEDDYKEVKIKFKTTNDVMNFISISNRFEGDITVYDGHLDFDGKSTVAMMNIPVNSILRVQIITTNPDEEKEFYETIKDYEVMN